LILEEQFYKYTCRPDSTGSGWSKIAVTAVISSLTMVIYGPAEQLFKNPPTQWH